MKTTNPGDAARIELLLAELRLPAVKLVWASLAAQADKEGWPAGRCLRPRSMCLPAIIPIVPGPRSASCLNSRPKANRSAARRAGIDRPWASIIFPTNGGGPSQIDNRGKPDLLVARRLPSYKFRWSRLRTRHQTQHPI